MAQELAGIYSEHGMHRESLRIHESILDPREVSATKLTASNFSALLRRKATSIIAEQGPTTTSDSLLSDARDASPYSENLTASITNTVAWGLLSDGKYGEAANLLESFHQRYSSAVFSADDNITAIAITAWNAAEIFHSYGVATSHLGKRYQSRAHRALSHAALIYAKCGTRPFAMRAGFWKGVLHLHHDLVKRGGKSINLMPRLPSHIDRMMGDLVSLLVRR